MLWNGVLVFPCQDLAIKLGLRSDNAVASRGVFELLANAIAVPRQHYHDPSPWWMHAPHRQTTFATTVIQSSRVWNCLRWLSVIKLGNGGSCSIGQELLLAVAFISWGAETDDALQGRYSVNTVLHKVGRQTMNISPIKQHITSVVTRNIGPSFCKR